MTPALQYMIRILLYIICAAVALRPDENPFFFLILSVLLFSAVILRRTAGGADSLKRRLAAGFIFPVAAVILIILKTSNGIAPSPDVILQGLVLGGVSFFCGTDRRDNGYSMILCAVLLLYGAVNSRQLFPFLLPVPLFLFLLLFADSRAGAFCRGEGGSGISGDLRFFSLYIPVFAAVASLFYLYLPLGKPTSVCRPNSAYSAVSAESLPQSGDSSGVPEINALNSADNIAADIKIKHPVQENPDQLPLYTAFFLVLVLIVFLVLFMVFPHILNLFRRYRAVSRYRRLCRDASECMELNPVQSLKLCYTALTGLLESVGYAREQAPGRDIFELGASLRKEDRQLSRDVLTVFLLYSQAFYGSRVPDSGAASEALECCVRVKDFILRNY